MIERAALDLIQKPNSRKFTCAKNGKVYRYFVYGDKQTKNDVISAREFLFSSKLDDLIESLGIEIDISRIRKKCL